MIPVSAFYIALTSLLILYLAYLVVRQRLSFKIGLQDGGNDGLSIAMRAHANAIETAVPTLLLMAAAELNGAPLWMIHLCGVAFVASRTFHAYGFTVSKGTMHAGRYYGTLITWVVIILLSGWILCDSAMRAF